MRFTAGVEYIGSHYAGWQRQHHADTVQGRIERALSRIADQPIEVTCAGRTDAGVHALGQVIHFDSPVAREPVSWLFGANALLPADISLRWVKPVSDDFHARFSAHSRQYRYLLHDSPARSALLNGRAAWSRQRLDESSMHQAAQCLLGEQDFSAFRAAECQSDTPMRCIQHLSVGRVQERVTVDIRANAFLHHMVRNIVGTLMAVGNGRQPPEWVETVLNSRDRSLAGVTAPAEGLYFMQVEYPAHFALPESGTTGIFPGP